MDASNQDPNKHKSKHPGRFTHSQDSRGLKCICSQNRSNKFAVADKQGQIKNKGDFTTDLTIKFSAYDKGYYNLVVFNEDYKKEIPFKVE